MHARSSTFRVPQDSMERGIALVRDEILPRFLDTEGCLGLSMMVDRAEGSSIVTTGWRDEMSMQASAQRATQEREQATQLLGGAVSDVQEWEVATMHRDHPTHEGCWVRSTWTRHDPANADHAIEVFKMGVLPRAQEMAGFCSASLLVERAAGTGVSSFAFDSKAALDSTRAPAELLRAKTMRELNAEIVDVHEYELVLAHLHVPEMA